MPPDNNHSHEHSAYGGNREFGDHLSEVLNIITGSEMDQVDPLGSWTWPEPWEEGFDEGGIWREPDWIELCRDLVEEYWQMKEREKEGYNPTENLVRESYISEIWKQVAERTMLALYYGKENDCPILGAAIAVHLEGVYEPHPYL